jgi:hypothetical protein
MDSCLPDLSKFYSTLNYAFPKIQNHPNFKQSPISNEPKNTQELSTSYPFTPNKTL